MNIASYNKAVKGKYRSKFLLKIAAKGFVAGLTVGLLVYGALFYVVAS